MARIKKIDNEGNIYSVRGIMKGTLRKDGYIQVIMDKGKCDLAHRVIAKALIPNPLNKPCINHKDGNRANNHPSNLEWCTYLENEKHAKKMWGKGRGEKNGMARFKRQDIAVMRVLFQLGYTLTELSHEYSCSSSRIHNIISRKSWAV